MSLKMCKKTLYGPHDFYWTISMSQDKKLLLSAGIKNKIVLWSISHFKIVRIILIIGNHAIYCVSINLN